MMKKSNSRPDIDVLNKFLPMSKRSNSRSESVFDLIRLSDSKRSQGHVELIISFVLFVGVLVALFIIINPFAKISRDVDVQEISQIIVDEMSSDVGKISVIVQPGADCYDVSEFIDGKALEVQDSVNLRKFTIYFSNELNNNIPHQDLSCPDSNFSLGVYSSEKIIVSNGIDNFKARYNGDYSALKSSLEINEDFSFSFSEIGGNLISDLSVLRNVPLGVEVYVSEFPVRVIDLDGKFYGYILKVEVWE